MKAPLVAGIIGLGVGKGHLAAYLSDPNVRVKTLADFCEQKITETRKEYPKLDYSTDPNSVLLDPEINIVSIASYDNYHAEQIILALDHGKHVFAEKPICLYPEEMRNIIAALKRNPSRQFASNLILRKCPRFLSLKQAIDTGVLGRLYYCEGDYLYGRIEKLLQGWRGEIPYYSILLGGGIHLVDLILWLTQDRVLEVSAMGNQLVSQGSQYRYPDFVVGLLRMESGAIVKISANFGCVSPHFHELKIFGDRGTFYNHTEKGEILLSRDLDKKLPPLQLNQPYPGVQKGDLLLDFLASLNNDKAHCVTPKEVFDAMAVCFALEKATKTCETVKVDYLN